MAQRVLMFTPYFPPHIGGLENYAAELARELAQRGHDIRVLTTHIPDGSPTVQRPRPGLVIYRFPAIELVEGFPLPAIWRAQWWRLLKHIWQLQPTIVVSHTRFFTTSLWAGATAFRKRCPWMHIEHGSAFVQVHNRFVTASARAYDLTFGRLVLKRADDVIAISEAVGKFVQQLAKRSSSVVYRGLPQEKIDRAPRWRPTDIPSQQLLIASVGRFVAWKGFDYSIASVQSLPLDTQKNTAYVIAGSGPDYARLQAKLNSHNANIVLTGALSADRTLGLLKESAIYIHSSLPGGGLSTALLEAMYCGCAIIATPNEGAAEFVIPNETGILIPAARPDALSRALVTLIHDEKLRHRLGKAARQQVQSRISWKQSGDKLTERFERLTR